MVLSNPARHLHQILTSFEEHSSADVSVGTCWQVTLNCSSDAVASSVSAALSLAAEVRTRIDSQGLSDQIPLAERYFDAWVRPFMPRDRGWDSGSHGLVDGDSLLSLNSLAAIFAAIQPPLASIVDAERTMTLLELLSDARAAVVEANDLPQVLRAALLDRLSDVQWAIDHFNIRGAAGLQAALERLGAEFARTSEHKGTSWRKKAGGALLFGFMIFSHTDSFAADLEAATSVMRELAEWVQDLPGHPPELGSGSSASSDQGLLDVVEAEIVQDVD